MGEKIFIPYGAIYYLGKVLYRTAKVGFLTVRDKNKRKKEIAKFVKEVLTIEELEKISEMVFLELISNVKFKKENLTTKELEEIKEIIDSVIESKVCATETPKFQILKKIQVWLEVILLLRDEKEMKRLGVDREEFIKQHLDFLNIEGKGDEKSN